MSRPPVFFYHPKDRCANKNRAKRNEIVEESAKSWDTERKRRIGEKMVEARPRDGVITDIDRPGKRERAEATPSAIRCMYIGERRVGGALKHSD